MIPNSSMERFAWLVHLPDISGPAEKICRMNGRGISVYWAIPAGKVPNLRAKQTDLLVSEENQGVECNCMTDEAMLNDKAIR